MNAPEPNIYDLANAARLCRASADAYAGPDDDSVIQSELTETRVVLTASEDDLIIAFRGTCNLRNWLTDLDCEFTREGNERVHAGFADALDSVQGRLCARIFAAPFHDWPRIWLTGHSLGGALAMLFAKRWTDCYLNQPFAGVYTFGQPRVGDAAFRDLYNAELRAKTFRVVHADDVVARVPWLLGSYRHAGHEIFYFPSSPQPALDGPWLGRLPEEIYQAYRAWQHGKLELLDDHHVNRYLTLFPKGLPQ